MHCFHYISQITLEDAWLLNTSNATYFCFISKDNETQRSYVRNPFLATPQLSGGVQIQTRLCSGQMILGMSYWQPPAVKKDCRHEPWLFTLVSRLLLLAWSGRTVHPTLRHNDSEGWLHSVCREKGRRLRKEGNQHRGPLIFPASVALVSTRLSR